jgi:nucleoside-diphosphate-sugar epimerase
LGKDAIEFRRGDIRDFGAVKKSMRGVNVVFHEAAQVSVPRSLKDPLHTNDVNVKGTLNLLKAAREEGVKRFVYASSSSVYGDPKSLPVTEDSAMSPLSPYAGSKIAGEAYCASFHESWKLPTVCLRYFNVFGARQSSKDYASVIPAFMQDAVQRKPMTIYGDGTQTRDFVHVTDVVEANMLALTVQAAVGNTFNIGTGRAVSVLQLSRIIGGFANSEEEPVHVSPRMGDVAHSVADIAKAQSLLGFNPRTDLQADLKALFESRGRYQRHRRR